MRDLLLLGCLNVFQGGLEGEVRDADDALQVYLVLTVISRSGQQTEQSAASAALTDSTENR